MTPQEIILTVGPLVTLVLLGFIVVWILTELRVALIFLGIICAAWLFSVGITAFWFWVAEALV